MCVYQGSLLHPQDWQLHIRYVQVRDDGVYECQVSSHPPVSLFATLRVLGESCVRLSLPFLLLSRVPHSLTSLIFNLFSCISCFLPWSVPCSFISLVFDVFSCCINCSFLLWGVYFSFIQLFGFFTHWFLFKLVFIRFVTYFCLSRFSILSFSVVRSLIHWFIRSLTHSVFQFLSFSLIIYLWFTFIYILSPQLALLHKSISLSLSNFA